MRELKMELSEYIPASFEIGDIVMLSNRFIRAKNYKWTVQYEGTLGTVVAIDWRWERLNVLTIFTDNAHEGAFDEFILVRKNSNLLVKLLS